MKTYNNVYNEVIALPNLYHAYREAKKGKKDIIFKKFTKNLHTNMWQLHKELLAQKYSMKPYTIFYVNDYKERKIMAPNFRDHIVHHAINNYLEQIYDSNFVYDSFACRKGKGTHKGFARLKHFVNVHSQNDYFMKCDISKYFYSIDQHKIMEILKRKIKDPKLLWLIEKILTSHNESEMPAHIANSHFSEQKKGLPIGNLTSQLFANIYLNELDQYAKHKLQVKHYIRYVDDFVIINPSKNELYRKWQNIRDFLEHELFLKLEQRKTQTNKISFGIDFIGYVAFKKFIRIRTRNYRRFVIRLKKRIYSYHLGRIPLEKLNATYISYCGHLLHTNSEKIKEKTEGLYKKSIVTASKNSGCFAAGIGTMAPMQALSAPT